MNRRGAVVSEAEPKTKQSEPVGGDAQPAALSRARGEKHSWPVEKLRKNDTSVHAKINKQKKTPLFLSPPQKAVYGVSTRLVRGFLIGWGGADGAVRSRMWEEEAGLCGPR